MINGSPWSLTSLEVDWLAAMSQVASYPMSRGDLGVALASATLSAALRVCGVLVVSPGSDLREA
jgi:hypothetical protein